MRRLYSGFFGWNYIYIRRTIRRSYAHALTLRASTNSGPGLGVQFTSSNDTASVHRGIQTESLAIESPHDREVDTRSRVESGQGSDYASVQRGRQAERPAVESPHDRERRLSSDDYEIESWQGNDTASVQRGRQTEDPSVKSPHDR